jgi:uncharacterized protein (TIGR02145 family)
VNDSRIIAPKGWHIPTDEEWARLESYIAANPGTSKTVGKALAAATDWNNFSEEGSIGKDLSKNNSSGFSALPGGYRFRGQFLKVGEYGGWWSTTESLENTAWIRVLFFSYGNMATIFQEKENAFSVRCVKD